MRFWIYLPEENFNSAHDLIFLPLLVAYNLIYRRCIISFGSIKKTYKIITGGEGVFI